MNLEFFNRIEAVIWFALAAILVVRLLRRRIQEGRGLVMIAIPTLILFGITDLIEVRTGAWWRPWELLLAKALCVAVLAGCLFQAWKKNR